MGLFLSAIFALGIGAWVYDRTMKHTHNTQTAGILGSVAGVLGFLIFFIARVVFLDNSNN